MYSVKKSLYNPLISPDKDHLWEELSTCNGSPIVVGDTTYIFYRAIADPDKMGATPGLSVSTIGLTWSKSGRDFTPRVQIIKPEHPWEEYGCEDPRITKFENRFYTFYTALSKFPLGPDGIKVAVAISDNIKEIQEKHPVTPFNAKAMALFPERINGKIYAILSVNTDKPPAEMAIRSFDTVEEMWDEEKWNKWYEKLGDHSLKIRLKETDHVEVGAVPIKTHAGWLLIYSYIENYFANDKVFGIRAVLLDLENPLKIIGQTKHSLLVPDEVYEKYGWVPNITFPSGAILNGDELDIYYGASDMTICRASVNLDLLLKSMFEKTRMKEIKRNPENPILSPSSNIWEDRSVFNPASLDIDGTVHILYRAMSKDNTSSIGYANSVDGLNIDYRQKEPAYSPKEDFELKKSPPDGNSGCEDPRLTMIGNKIYMCYTAYDGIIPPRVAVTSISKADFVARKWKWEKSRLLTPQGVDDKDACIFPELIAGKFGLIHRIAHTICLDLIDDLSGNSVIHRCVSIMEPRSGMWDSRKIGLSSVPHKTKDGWLMIYHGIGNDGVYRVGAALLDLKDPTHVLSRTAESIMEPEKDYEKSGEISNVVFPCGSVIRDNKVFIYYGGADRYVCSAEVPLSYLLKILKI